MLDNDSDSDSDTDDDLIITNINGVTPVAGTAIDILADPNDPTSDVIGQLEIDPETGEFAFIPAQGFRGEAMIEYEVCDEGGNCGSAVLEIPIADISSASELLTVVPNGDNFDVTTRITVTNTGATLLDNIIVRDDIGARFGVAIVDVQIPVLDVSGITSGVAPPTINSNWLVDSSANLVTDGTRLGAGDSFTLTFTATINLNAGGLSAPLTNQAFVQGTDAATPSVVVGDFSEQPNDPVGNNDAPIIVGDEELNDDMLDDVIDLSLPSISVTNQQGDVTLDRASLHWLVDYHFIVENTGTTALNQVDLINNIEAIFGDAFVRIDTGSLAISGFTGTGIPPTANLDWETNTSLNILLGDVELNPGDRFAVDFSVWVDSANLTTDLANTANVTAQGLDADGNPLLNGLVSDISDSGNDPRSSNPDAPGDRNTSNDPTPLIVDLDGDFISDFEESTTEDRDGISDADDFDPGGYFYDVATGQILRGGSIRVTGPIPGSVNLIDAGQDGSYQFFGIAPFSGTYTIGVTAPEGYELDRTLLENGSYDPTDTGTPVNLGAGEFQSTGFLSDASPSHYYLSFDLEVGDPIVINNNIPFRRIALPGTAFDSFNRSGGGASNIATPVPLEIELMSSVYQGPLQLSALYQAEFSDDLPSLGRAGATANESTEFDDAPELGNTTGLSDASVDDDRDGIEDHINVNDNNPDDVGLIERRDIDTEEVINADVIPDRLDTDKKTDGISVLEETELAEAGLGRNGPIAPVHLVDNDGFSNSHVTSVDYGEPTSDVTTEEQRDINMSKPIGPAPAGNTMLTRLFRMLHLG